MVDDPSMTFGEKLKMLARTRNLSRDAILAGVAARGVELSKSALGNYFADVARPQLGTALALARVLGVSLDFLADDAMEQEPTASSAEAGGITPDERAVLGFYRLQRKREGEAFSPEELGWRIAEPRYADAPAIGRSEADQGVPNGHGRANSAGLGGGAG